jgi:hypothetical protein
MQHRTWQELNQDFLSRLRGLARAGRHFATEVTAFQKGRLPFVRALRTGLSIAAGLIGLAVTGHFESAVICAITTNLLTFVDQLGPLRERLWVLAVAALCFASAGALGGAIAGNAPVVLLTAFAFASFAGLVHGSLPGVELIPRNSLICLVIGAYLPQLGPPAVLGVACGAFLAIFGAYCEHRVRPNIYAPALASAREVVTYQAPRFASLYGAAAVGGLALGYFMDDIKPYWVTITTLVVMQPGRRANTLRATQRFLGTMSGVVAVYLLTAITGGAWRHGILLVLAVATPFFWHLAFARNYAFGVAVLSFWILVLLDLAMPPEAQTTALFMARLVDTAIGCALALVASLLIEEQTKYATAPGDSS